MPQSLARNVVHLIFSTKNRQPLLVPELREGIFPYMAGTLRGIECPAIQLGGMADHVHILFVLSKNLKLTKAVEEVKKSSSIWAKEHGAPEFYWQGGYGAFSVSASNEDKVVEYIRRQEEHHSEMTFQTEFRKFLKKHRIEWDERYVWD
jgi:putative transposase